MFNKCITSDSLCIALDLVRSSAVNSEMFSYACSMSICRSECLTNLHGQKIPLKIEYICRARHTTVHYIWLTVYEVTTRHWHLFKFTVSERQKQKCTKKSTKH